MPTITFSHKDFNNLLGKKTTIEELKTLLEYAKAEIDAANGDEINVKFNDTNQPYLWSPEGIALLLRGVLEKEKGIPQLKINKTNNHIIVDKNLAQIRPFISAFTAKGKKIDEYLLKQIIQLQEKLCENYGRRRQKIAIGVYPAEKINFPLKYEAVAPDETSFTALGERTAKTLKEILETHQKGKEYSWILAEQKKYPLLSDAKKQVLSFPPIINSETMGKLEEGNDYIFFETTGTDEKSVNLATIIFAYALQMRGFQISAVTINYGDRKVIAPATQTQKIKISKEQIKEALGLELSDREIKELLERAGYNFSNYSVEIPPYRNDIMHFRDVIEDIAILYGYNNIEPLPLTTFTRGSSLQATQFIDATRELLAGQGYQEIFSALLSNKTIMQQKMKLKQELVEIENYTSQTYSAVRNSILPILLETLAQNKHVDYPQKIFEQGLATKKNGDKITDHQVIAIANSHSTANFTEIRQTINCFLGLLGLYDFEIKETEHPSFIQGRAVSIILDNEIIGTFGEIHPEILANFGIEMPVVAAELNAEKLYEKAKK